MSPHLDFRKHTLEAVRGSLGCSREASQEVRWVVMQVRSKEAVEVKKRKQIQKITGSRINRT